MAKSQGTNKRRPAAKPKRERKSRSIQFPEGTIAKAVADRGLMDVQVMEALGVGSSTWFRWKRTDRVPTNQIYSVTTLLGLPEPVSDGDAPRNPWFVLRMLEDFDARLARLERHFGEEAPARRRPRSS